MAIAVATVSAQFEDVQSLRARATAALAQLDGELPVAGLQAPVEVIRDRWGVPHIYASTLDDLFFAQGLVASQDRLWQLELWRRTAEGTLAEVLGPPAVNRDVFARLLRYRGDMDAEWASYSPDAKRIITAFVRGINAQIAYVTTHPGKLPIEFQLTGIRPMPWTPEIVLSRMAGYVMTRNARTEVQRARLAQAIGLERVNDFMPPDPSVPLTVPDGLDLSDITERILDLTESAADPIRFDARLAADGGPCADIARTIGPRAPCGPGPSPGEALARAADQYLTAGSNNWVVAGRLTSTGRPLLANDPHRPLPLPSLRYTVHLEGPGWRVIGAGEPALPGIAAGHNDRVAFGFTIVGTDQQDLYVERLNPTNQEQYLYRGQWESMRVEREWVPVKGEAPRAIELRFTRHGPVIHIDRERQRAYALRWVGMEPGTAGYLAGLSLDVARDWREFGAALERWKVPSENLVYADVDGNIGWVAAGLTPVRPNWNGLLPVPGQDGKYEWNGFLPLSELPQSYNPASGVIATANHNILPNGYSKMLGYEWGAPFRYQRIMDVLTRVPGPSAAHLEKGFTRADFEGLQHDEHSVVARVVVRSLAVAAAAQPVDGTDRTLAVRLLTSWNGHLSRESAAAALYEVWMPHLLKAMMATIARRQELPLVAERVSIEKLVAILSAPTPAQTAVLTGPTLDAAVADARVRMGDDPSRWAWGRIHYALFDHPLATTPARQKLMNLAPVPRGGDATTPNATGAGLRQTSGASYREVLDVGAWDESSTINVPGASGQPMSPHYGDLLPLWSDGQYHPMPFSRDAVEKHAAHRLRLVLPSAVSVSTPQAPTEAAPVLPPFAGTVVNFDRRGGRVAACALDPAGGERRVGARAIANTRVWVVEQEVVRQLGESTGACDPVWSPDAMRLAVVQPNGLWTYSPTLGDPQHLAETHLPREPRNEFDYTAFARPRWSPDGRYIAIVVTNGASSWIEVVDSGNGRRAFKSDANVTEATWVASGHVLLIAGREVVIH